MKASRLFSNNYTPGSSYVYLFFYNWKGLIREFRDFFLENRDLFDSLVIHFKTCIFINDFNLYINIEKEGALY